MPLYLGHRGYSAKYLENSMQAFRAALDSGMDGFELDVQPTADGVSVVLHDDDFSRTAQKGGVLRRMKSSELPLLGNGEPPPRLEDALSLGAGLVNVELKGAPGWAEALAVVQKCRALGRVLFSSFEHGEIDRLAASCPEARCGYLWNERDADALAAPDIGALPLSFTLHPPLRSVAKRPDFWRPYAGRLALWGLVTPADADALGFIPAIIISDGI